MHLLNILHLSDPTLPIGGYTHSNGLETYVQEGLVHNAATAEAGLRLMVAGCTAVRAASMTFWPWFSSARLPR